MHYHALKGPNRCQLQLSPSSREPYFPFNCCISQRRRLIYDALLANAPKSPPRYSISHKLRVIFTTCTESDDHTLHTSQSGKQEEPFQIFERQVPFYPFTFKHLAPVSVCPLLHYALCNCSKQCYKRSHIYIIVVIHKHRY